MWYMLILYLGKFDLSPVEVDLKSCEAVKSILKDTGPAGAPRTGGSTAWHMGPMASRKEHRIIMDWDWDP